MPPTTLRLYALLGTLIAALLVITTIPGLFVTGLYTPFIKTEALLVGLPVQDLVSLIVAPLLLAAIWAARRGSWQALIVWAGLLVYVAYYYAFYCFGYVYTLFYPLYLALMGLATASLVGLLTSIDLTTFRQHISDGLPVRFISGVLGMALLFVPIWLSRLAQGINTQQVNEADLVFVLDLAFLVPAMAFAALQLWRRRPVGYLLGGVLLVKAAISGILLTLGSLRQLQLGFTVAPEELGMYLLLALAGSSALLQYLRHLHNDMPQPAEPPATSLSLHAKA
jgi:hypothetical protein